MIQLREIDENGLFVADVFFDTVPLLMETVLVDEVDEEGNPVQVPVEQPVLDEFGNTIPVPHYIETPVPQESGFHHPKWNGEAWVEGLTPEQITANQNQPVKLTPEQEELKSLKTRLNETENAMMILMEMQMMGGL